MDTHLYGSLVLSLFLCPVEPSSHHFYCSTPVLQMEVGIEDCLHIEFEYDRAGYHLTDTVIGKIYFLLVRIKLKHMELEIKRRETVGGGVSARAESETVAKYEIMDGAPARGEVIPIRLHLSPYDLTPSYPNVHNKFGVRYSINLVLVDDEDRRYFKQQEITLYRVPPSQGKENKSLSGGLGAMEANGGRAPAVTPRTAARAMSGEGHAVATPEKGFGAAGAAGGSPGTNESPGDIRFGDDGDGAEERGAAGQEADTGPPL